MIRSFLDSKVKCKETIINNFMKNKAPYDYIIPQLNLKREKEILFDFQFNFYVDILPKLIRLKELLPTIDYGDNIWGYYLEKKKHTIFIPCQAIYKCFYSERNFNISLNNGYLKNLYDDYELNDNKIHLSLKKNIRKDTAIVLSHLLCDDIARNKFYYYFIQKSMYKSNPYKIYFPCHGNINISANITIMNGHSKKIYYANNIDYLNLPRPRDKCTQNLYNNNKIRYIKSFHDLSENNFTQLMLFLNRLKFIKFMYHYNLIFKNNLRLKSGTLLYTVKYRNKYFRIIYSPHKKYNLVIFSYKNEPLEYTNLQFIDKTNNRKKELPGQSFYNKIDKSILPTNLMTKRQKKKWLKIILGRLS